jgi:hypothetical protein
MYLAEDRVRPHRNIFLCYLMDSIDLVLGARIKTGSRLDFALRQVCVWRDGHA